MTGREKLRWELEQAFDNNGDWFTCHVFRLIAKADTQNRERLRIIFPDEVEVYEAFLEGRL